MRLSRLHHALSACMLLSALVLAPNARADAPNGQRVVVVMVDGLGTDYVAQSDMPVLKRLMKQGVSATVQSVMPSVTNVNNASIACGAWPAEHGITGNSYYDEARGEAMYMEDARSLL